MRFKIVEENIYQYFCDAAAGTCTVYMVYEAERPLCYSKDKRDVLPVVAAVNREARTLENT